MKKVILCVASGSAPRFAKGLNRMLASLDAVGETCDRLTRTDLPPGCPSHADAPFAFKPYIFKEARELGYTHALWLDSSMVAHKPLGPIWEAIEADGGFFWNGGWYIGQWTSDRCLEGMGLSREESWSMLMIQASVIGLKFSDDRGFLDEWLKHVDLFHGAWTNKHREVSSHPDCLGHRHDQSVASVLACRMGFPLWEPPMLVYDGVTEETLLQNKGVE